LIPHRTRHSDLFLKGQVFLCPLDVLCPYPETVNRHRFLITLLVSSPVSPFLGLQSSRFASQTDIQPLIDALHLRIELLVAYWKHHDVVNN
jgi:hypothetical protein